MDLDCHARGQTHVVVGLLLTLVEARVVVGIQLQEEGQTVYYAVVVVGVLGELDQGVADVLNLGLALPLLVDHRKQSEQHSLDCVVAQGGQVDEEVNVVEAAVELGHFGVVLEQLLDSQLTRSVLLMFLLPVLWICVVQGQHSLRRGHLMGHVMLNIDLVVLVVVVKVIVVIVVHFIVVVLQLDGGLLRLLIVVVFVAEIRGIFVLAVYLIVLQKPLEFHGHLLQLRGEQFDHLRVHLNQDVFRVLLVQLAQELRNALAFFGGVAGFGGEFALFARLNEAVQLLQLAHQVLFELRTLAFFGELFLLLLVQFLLAEGMLLLRNFERIQLHVVRNAVEVARVDAVELQGVDGEVALLEVEDGRGG